MPTSARRRVEESVRTSGIVGTPAYMSPSRPAGGAPGGTPARTCSASGPLFYEAAHRAAAVQRPDPVRAVGRIVTADPPPHRHLDPTVPRELSGSASRPWPRRGRAYATAKGLGRNDLRHCSTARSSSSVEVPILPAAAPAHRAPRRPQRAAFVRGPGRVLLPVAVAGPFPGTGCPKAFASGRSDRGPELAATVPVGWFTARPGVEEFAGQGRRCYRAWRRASGRLTSRRRRRKPRPPAGGNPQDVPGVPADAGLVPDGRGRRPSDAEATGEKLLIVIDQFEQWLHGHAADPGATELVRAVRHCGRRAVQCLVTVSGTTSGSESRGSCGSSNSGWSRFRTRPWWTCSTRGTPGRYSPISAGRGAACRPNR